MSKNKETSKKIFDKKLYQHDAFDKSVFRNARYVREIVEWICQDRQELLEILDVEHIEICPESYLDDELKEYFVDVLYRIPLKNGYAVTMFILIEIKTSNDRFTIFQMAKYIVRIWDAALKAAKLKKEKKKEQEQENPESAADDIDLASWLFPPIFPVIIHHGEYRFTAPTKLVALQHKIPGLKGTLDLESFLLDMTPMPDEEMPTDLEFGSLCRTMRDVFKKDVDVRLVEIYKKLYPYFHKMPELLDVWQKILYYAVTSSAHFTLEKYDATTETIREIRGDNMSIAEQPFCLYDALVAREEARGEARGEIRGILKTRFEQVPTQVSKRLLEIADLVVLESLAVTATESKTLEEFENALGECAT